MQDRAGSDHGPPTYHPMAYRACAKSDHGPIVAGRAGTEKSEVRRPHLETSRWLVAFGVGAGFSHMER